MRRWTTSTASSSSESSRNLPRRPAAVTRPADEPGLQLGGRLAPDGAPPENLDVVDPPPDERAFEAPADGLDLGELGHLGRRGRRLHAADEELEGGGGGDALGVLLGGPGAVAEELSADGTPRP